MHMLNAFWKDVKKAVKHCTRMLAILVTKCKPKVPFDTW